MPISDDARFRMRALSKGGARFQGGKKFFKQSTMDRRERVSRGDAWKQAVARLPAPAVHALRFACQRAWESEPERFTDKFKSHWDRGDFWRVVPGIIRRGDAFQNEPEWIVLTRNFDNQGGWDV